jgi:ketosteroid isomerase-like protein
MKLVTKSPAQEIFESFCEYYNNRKLDEILDLFACNTKVWGTAEDEYIVGQESLKKQLERDWRQSEKSEIHIKSFVPAVDNAIWAAAICQAKITLHDTEYIFDHLRGTIIIAKEEDMWRISHMHSSFPDYRNVEGSSFPIS